MEAGTSKVVVAGLDPAIHPLFGPSAIAARKLLHVIQPSTSLGTAK
jgi:hypothetical protein